MTMEIFERAEPEAVLLVMVLMHMLADYTLQGWLADGKQKAWWKKMVPNLEETKYRYDYVVALLCHSLYWSILICLPFWLHPSCWAMVIFNTGVHMLVDHLKANRLCINLVQDQALHGLQILITWMTLV